MKVSLTLLLLGFSLGAHAEVNMAKAYSCKLIQKNGKSRYDSIIFSDEGLIKAKMAYLNSLIITNNGFIFQPDKDRDDSLQLGDVPERPPKVDRIASVECTETNLSINLGSN